MSILKTFLALLIAVHCLPGCAGVAQSIADGSGGLITVRDRSRNYDRFLNNDRYLYAHRMSDGRVCRGYSHPDRGITRGCSAYERRR